MRRTTHAALLTILCLAALVFCAPARGRLASQERIEAPATKCEVRAYVVDPDPQGLNVRAGPGKAFPVLGTIKKTESTVGLIITGATDQWVVVRDAETQEEGEKVYAGPGWVYAPMLATETKNYSGPDPNKPNVKLYREPSKRAAVVTLLPNEMQVTVVGCKGAWAQVRHQKFTGWLDPDSQCANTLTTCS